MSANRSLPAADPQVATRKILKDEDVKEYRSVAFIQGMVTEGFLQVAEVKNFIVSARERKMSFIDYASLALSINEEELVRIMAPSYGMQLVDLTQVPLRDEFVKDITADEAWDMRVVAYGINDEGQVLAAMADPSNVDARKLLPQRLGRGVDFLIASPNQVEMALRQLYPDFDPVDREALEIDHAAKDAAKRTEQDIRAAGGETAAVPRLINRVLDEAYKLGASDIHIEPFEKNVFLRFRVNGKLRDGDSIEIPRNLASEVVSRIKVMSSLDIAEKRKPQDGRAEYRLKNGKRLDLRIAVVPVVYGESVVIRLLDPDNIRVTIEQLGFTKKNQEVFLRAIHQPWGAVIITGPTGSGKTTTLYSALNEIIDGGNDRSKKVWTVEDPVEYRLHTVNQVQVSEKAKVTFASALRSLLRADPDVMMVGEVRDPETAKIAVEASLTGHMVLTTLHTNDAPTAISRLDEMGVDAFLIANSVELIVAQRLVAVLCESCKVEKIVDKEYFESIHAPKWAIQHLERTGGTLSIYEVNPEGCPTCKGEGHKGRTGVHQLMPMTPKIRELIVKGSDKDTIERQARLDGMFSLREDAFLKVIQGKLSLQDMAAVVNS